MYKTFLIWLVFFLTSGILYTQDSPVYSRLLDLNLPDHFIKEKNFFAVLAGQTVLELEAEPQRITVEEAEILSWKNPGANLAESELMLNSVLEILHQAGWQITSSPRDQDYHWLVRKNVYLIGYFAATSRETAVYIGRISQLPTFIKISSPPIGPSQVPPSPETPHSNSPNLTTADSEIVGNWGELKASQINYYDPTGMMVGSGLSKGYGFEFKSDQSYAQSFLATSSRPDYKIFIYTTGTFIIKGNQLILNPMDRHYRKWESKVLTTDEHSLPEAEQYTWSKKQNSITGKKCLYLIRTGETESREYCQD